MKSWRIVTPLIALAAFGLTACSNSEEAATTAGTTPAVFSAAPNPNGEATTTAEDTSRSTDSIVGNLAGPDGTSVGTATFSTEANHVKIVVEAKGLTPGFHGFHVHSVGKCEANSVAPAGGEPGNFLSAGGHLQVGGRTEHPASGDLTSLQVLADGTAELTTTTDAFTLADLRNSGNGTAVMVHSGPDNFANIPTRYTLPNGAAVPDETTLTTGDAGSRVACAVLK